MRSQTWTRENIRAGDSIWVRLDVKMTAGHGLAAFRGSMEIASLNNLEILKAEHQLRIGDWVQCREHNHRLGKITMRLSEAGLPCAPDQPPASLVVMLENQKPPVVVDPRSVILHNVKGVPHEP
jgi:hypothetical protein